MNASIMAEQIQLHGEQALKRQYLTFFMAEEEYGIDILSVQELRNWEDITEIPNSPEYIKGVINLRGTIVPITDLRARFGLAPLEYGPLTVVIIAKVTIDDKSKIVGLVVDEVSDVYSVDDEDTKEVPQYHDSLDNRFASQIMAVQDKMIILVNLENIFAEQ